MGLTVITRSRSLIESLNITILVRPCCDVMWWWWIPDSHRRSQIYHIYIKASVREQWRVKVGGGWRLWPVYYCGKESTGTLSILLNSFLPPSLSSPPLLYLKTLTLITASTHHSQFPGFNKFEIFFYWLNTDVMLSLNSQLREEVKSKLRENISAQPPCSNPGKYWTNYCT